MNATPNMNMSPPPMFAPPTAAVITRYAKPRKMPRHASGTAARASRRSRAARRAGERKSTEQPTSTVTVQVSELA